MTAKSCTLGDLLHMCLLVTYANVAHAPGDAFFHLVQPDELRDGLVAFGLGMLQGGVAIVVS